MMILELLVSMYHTMFLFADDFKPVGVRNAYPTTADSQHG